MENIDKIPLWVRLYARKENIKLIWQFAGIILGIAVVAFLDYMLEGREVTGFFSAEQVFKYFTLMVVFSVHVIMVSSSNKWILKNSSIDKLEGQTLKKIYSYLIGLAMIILLVLVKEFIFE